jgi:glycogen operon protein
MRIAGSNDLYSPDDGRSAFSSINFITCHDGFNLLDLVSYNEKHNEGNGENNCDGADDNLSWNHGVEGPSDDEGINEFRWRQRANLFATLMWSLGVPMMLGGDELSETQCGNNNTYCQDSELTWINWDIEKNPGAQDFLEFVSKVIHIRHTQPVLERRRHLKGESSKGLKDVIWYLPEGREPQHPEWNDPGRQALGWILDGNAIDELSHTGVIHVGDTLLFLLNGHFHDVKFKIPAHITIHSPENLGWKLLLSTDRSLKEKFGKQIYPPNEEFLLKDHSFSVFCLNKPKARRVRISFPKKTEPLSCESCIHESEIAEK